MGAAPRDLDRVNRLAAPREPAILFEHTPLWIVRHGRYDFYVMTLPGKIFGEAGRVRGRTRRLGPVNNRGDQNPASGHTSLPERVKQPPLCSYRISGVAPRTADAVDPGAAAAVLGPGG